MSAGCNLGVIHSNFCSEDCPKNILLPYLPDIMNKLESVLKAKFNELVEKGNKVNAVSLSRSDSFHQLFPHVPTAAMIG
jgi:hypothetical protein